MILPNEILPILKEKKLIILSTLFLGILLAFVITFFLPKLYISSAKINFNFESVNSPLIKNSGSLQNETQNLLSSKNLLVTVKTLIKSENRLNFSLLNKTIDEVDNNNIQSPAVQNLYSKKIKEATEIITDESTASIGVKVIAKNAIESAEIADAIVNSFTNYAIPNSKKSYLSILRTIEKRKKENLKAIKRNNNNLGEYIASASLKSLNPNDEYIVDNIAELEAELEAIEFDNNYSISYLEYLQSFLEEEFTKINSTISSLDNPKINETKNIIEKIKTEKIIGLATKKVNNLNIEYPWKKSSITSDINSLNSKLKKLVFDLIEVKFPTIKKQELLKNLVWKIEETTVALNTIDFSKVIVYNLLTSLEKKFNSIPIRYIELARLIRTKKIHTKLDLKLKNKELSFKKKEKNYFAEIDSVVKAIIPTSYFSPNTTLNILLGLLGGLLIGVLLVLFTSSSTLNNIEFATDLEKAGYKVISQIPYISNNSTSILELHSKIKTNINETKFTKAFQNIDAFLKYGNLEKKATSVLITSSVEQEGKTMVAANIATAIANEEEKEKILLVDLNFKTPTLNKFFNVDSSNSLPHYLFKKKEFNEIVKPTAIKNLSLITCIELTQNPSVIISSERVQNFIKKVNQEFDYVIYDCSSLSTLKETIEIAKIVDEVILVVRANQTQLSQLKTTETLLRNGGISEFDIILNDVKI